MKLDLELNRNNYNFPRLTLLSWTLTAASLGCIIASHYGSYPEAVDVCLYPRAAQIKDEKVREQQLQDVSINSANALENKLLLGSKFCNYRRGDIVTLPKSYVLNAENGSLNDAANSKAIVSVGLKEGWLYRYQEVSAENPYKMPLAVAGFGLGIGAMAAIQYQKDKQAKLRPMYRATMLLENRRAGYSLALAESDLQMSAELLLGKLRGIREAEARDFFLSRVTDEQAFNLLGSMTSEDYQNFGYLLDGGASYSKFLQPGLTEEAELENQNYVAVELPEGEETPQPKQYTRTDNIPKQDKYEPFRQQGLSIIKQAGSPGKSKALIAPSRTGKTTVLYFMLQECYKLVGEENLTCYVWQGKGIEPVHPNIPKQNHAGFSHKDFGLESLDSAWEEYEVRQKLLEQGYRDFAPVLLIVTDWQSMKDQMSALDSATFKDVAAKLMTLANNGAALGVTIWLDTQSPVTESWGLGDASIRDNFDIFALARIGTDANGQIIGDTKCITKVLKNNYLVPNERDRVTMTEQYNLLIDGMESGKIDTSVLLSTAGKVRLGITPKFERTSLQFAGVTAPTQEPKQEPTQVTETEPTEQETEMKQPPKVAYVKSEENQELSLKQKVKLLIAGGKNYKQICESLWGSRPIEEIAPLLGCQCRLDKIDILSELAKSLLSLLRGKGWMDVSSQDFIDLVTEDLAPIQVTEAIEELTLLGYCQLDDNKIRALY